MSVSISPQIKVLALMGLLLIAVAGGYKYVLHRHANESVVIPPVVHHTPPATPAKAKTPAATHAHKKPPVSSSEKSAAASAARSAARQVHLNAVNPLLPASLRWTLALHRIVVVSLWDPEAPVDQISVAEAHAGAADAHVGFLVVDVLDNSVAGPLTALLPTGDMLPDPGVLVYRAPGKIVYRFDGFLDRAAVAQAAANAKAGLDTAPAAEATLP